MLLFPSHQINAALLLIVILLVIGYVFYDVVLFLIWINSMKFNWLVINDSVQFGGEIFKGCDLA
ncbi:putative membrane protein [Pectobacterium atrosepticum SCRI1043]|uniref:Membrane protein n=1 Tax=Pectobacterium atrosepticum (strain SCRI 1043 / ATCC BAA-672) TaxID=218491 RepID=Q6D4T6_PECAS|nr:hypothetical protein EV46_11070 [Pectobacterium atrosepticum]KMK78954.1 hypothetical protein KCQ_16337 [Pectobacterium atrosepticum ICMP 1526]CAG75207.1 putative membrane protein [Pectobacterium atrosepticum SCRI1043]ATY90882.1 hypothetical protein CVS35_11190 [Pectobacterium atrosepticum]KFX14102.1 hypothetical protein JV34_13820 [Pectobacterium atrosepticum]